MEMGGDLRGQIWNYLKDSLELLSGIGTGGSGGSMNRGRGPE